MGEPEQRQLLGRALTLLAIVLMTSGIVVRTMPLESKRPVDPEHAKFSHAGLQDVEARLWEDPFGAIRHIQGSTPGERCEKALEDKRHHPYALSNLITFVSRRSDITVLPVLIQGGPHFENGESRRRARYAVVMALLNAGWEPSDEDKIGYVWTFEGCIENAWARQIPELLPYEWFVKGPEQPSDQLHAQSPRRHRVLILWVDEDAVSRRPLRGFGQLAELFAHPGTLCDPRTADKKEDNQGLAPARHALANKLREKKVCPKIDKFNLDTVKHRRASLCSDSERNLPWCDMRVIGPSTSPPLQSVVRELASPQPDSDPPPPTRFFSATATADLNEEFSRALERAKSRGNAPKSTKITQATQNEIEDLKKRFHERVVRLTTTDEKLAKALVEELRWRLEDKTPWQRLVTWWERRPVLCDDTIIIVGEGDTPYARFFREHFMKPAQQSVSPLQKDCGGGVVQVSYLRGLDGVLPTGTGAQASSTPQKAASGGTDTRAGTIGNILPDQATLERADGRSQYDYLRRLGEHLIALDRRKRQEGYGGVTAIGVLGNDTYDKLLVLDALREYFPRAIFFAADLDARLIGREARRSTRNLVVASAYGLKLHPDLQGAAPPFRDTYQTGIYLSTRVAMDPVARQLSTDKFDKWFGEPRLFEIGRARAVALSRAGVRPCEQPDPQQCEIIHPDDEWHGFDPLPDRWATLAVAVMVLTASGSALLLSDRAYSTVRKTMAWFNNKPSRWGVLSVVLVLALGLFVAGLWVIKYDVETATGEPFAWLEGISIWPTQILQMLLLILTGVLLVGGRAWLRHKIDEVAKKFHVQTLTDREKTPSPTLIPNMRALVRWLWGLGGCPRAKTVEGKSAIDLWREFLDRMRRKPSTIRVVWATFLLFLFSLALLSLDWPSSPHRGILSAWFNHVLQLLLLAGMTAVLVSALDASMMATRLLRACLDQYREVPRWPELVRQALVERDQAVDHVQCAAEVTSAVNLLIYLPFLTFLLLVPARSRVFDAWVLPLPYVVLILLAIGVALLHTIALRRVAAGRRAEVLADMDQMAERYTLQAKLAQEGVPDTLDGVSEPSASAKADLLKSRADRLRGVRDGHFRPLGQEPVVRALLLLLGGTGALTIVEFLFLGQG